jgi:rsbT co-antagonist protein RsbR
MEDLLRAIQTHQADVVLLDITGVSLVDTSVANSLIQVTRAAALLGSTTILVGVSAAVSRTLVQLGIDLAQVSTQRDLQAGIALALRLRGYAIVRSRPEVDWLSEFDRDPR